MAVSEYPLTEVGGYINVYDVSSGQVIASHTPFAPQLGMQISKINWSHDGVSLAAITAYSASTGLNNRIIIWDYITNQSREIINASQSNLNAVSWSPDDSKLATTSLESEINIWDTTSGLESLTIFPQLHPLSIDWSNSGQFIASTTIGEGAKTDIWDAFTGENILSIPSGASDVVWMNSDTWLVTRTFDSIDLWDSTSGNLLSTIQSPESIFSMSFSPLGDRLLIGLGSGTLENIQMPIADAGLDQTLIADSSGVALINLNASSSFDNDGLITQYRWFVNGADIASGVTPEIMLETGTYIVTLVVVDDDNAIASDELLVEILQNSDPNPPSYSSTPTRIPTFAH